ncbi:DNA repair protein RadA [Phycisphaerales bacterium]|nr:DNA repair protein RadA [Phycisphaerales bacterium]
MSKLRRAFVCRSCASAHARWMGKCPDCGTWDALEETTVDPLAEKDPQRGLAAAFIEPNGAADTGSVKALPLSDIGADDQPLRRIPSGIGELDRVLGGAHGNLGLVPGSAVLVGGEPGIGKSTLLLQAAYAWAAAGTPVLYVSSEESAQQIALRARRLAEAAGRSLPGATGSDKLFVLADTNLARIVEQARRNGPKVMVIDSVQMIYKPDIPAGAGSVTQLRRCCSELVYLAKASGICVVLVGHVTKDGQLAGPRLLEHLVDAVLYFDGDRHHAHRVVRAVKNRFGTTLELGLFEMTGGGLRELPEGAGPAATGESRPGSVVCPVLSGTRCILVEVQALTATGFLGAAKRKASGIDSNRLAMLIAVLEQHAGLRLADRDLFASSVGGVRVVEPASDLALLLAIAGAHYKKALPPRTACAGEVGLGGEIRPIPALEQRAREAQRLGYTHLLVPPGTRTPVKGLELVPVKTVDRAMEHLG